jgi:hypothetical protein
MNEAFDFSTEIPVPELAPLADIAGIVFNRIGRYNRWTMEKHNPYVFLNRPEEA